MSVSNPTENSSRALDSVDRKILHCLQVAPRVPFLQIARVLEVSEQTVARRYRRMRGDGVVRVIGIVDPMASGEASWGLRLRCRPDAAEQIAASLAARQDVGWVVLMSGGSEVGAAIRAPTSRQREELLLRQLPRTSAVLSIDAFTYLQVFRGASRDDWRLGTELLTPQQISALMEHRVLRTGERVPATADDRKLLQVLGTDARCSYADIAAATGWSEAKSARRLRGLLEGGAVYLDVDVDAEELGLRMQAWISLVVSPGRIEAVGTAIAEHPQSAFVAATTGSANLTASVVLPDAAALYRYLTVDLGAIEGIQQVSTTPIVRVVKQSGTVLPGPGSGTRRR